MSWLALSLKPLLMATSLQQACREAQQGRERCCAGLGCGNCGGIKLTGTSTQFCSDAGRHGAALSGRWRHVSRAFMRFPVRRYAASELQAECSGLAPKCRPRFQAARVASCVGAGAFRRSRVNNKSRQKNGLPKTTGSDSESTLEGPRW